MMFSPITIQPIGFAETTPSRISEMQNSSEITRVMTYPSAASAR